MPECPNILLITTDQQRYDTVSALGNPHIFTPHLDYLAQHGISFTRCYTDSPICVPARNTIMTGLCAYTTGRHHMGAWEKEPAALHPTLPGILTAAGYQTKAVGKMHFLPMRAHFGLEDVELPADYMRYMAKHPEKGIPMDHGVGQNESVPVFSTVHESHSLTHWIVERSVDFLETRDDTRPFFLWTSFTKPHAPYDCQKEYWDLYADMDIPDPVFGDWSEDPDKIDAGWMEPTWMLNNNQHDNPNKLKAAKRAYYACVSQIDYNLGLLFARLGEMNLLENTWILFTTDHGDMLGDHHMGAKHLHLEGSAHIPLILRPPGPAWDPDNERREARVDDLAQLADLLPTVLALAGVERPDDCTPDGINLLADDPTERRERTHLYGRAQAFHAIIEKEYKYCFCGLGGSELLFHLKEDPAETRNLAGDPSHLETLRRLRKRMCEYLEKQNEPVRENRPQSTGQPRSQREVRRTRLPGFHSRLYPCDVLH